MTARRPILLICDWPIVYKTLGSGEVLSCYERIELPGKRTDAAARQQAATTDRGGWWAAGPFDFCGTGRTFYMGLGRSDMPNHAELLRAGGHRPVNDKVKPSEAVQASWRLADRRPRCACGWQPAADVAHLDLFLGLTTSRERAEQVWFDVHLREDLAGLSRLWTVDQVAAHRSDLDRTLRPRPAGEH